MEKVLIFGIFIKEPKNSGLGVKISAGGSIEKGYGDLCNWLEGGDEVWPSKVLNILLALKLHSLKND